MLACVTCSMDPWFSKNRCQNLGTGAAKKKHSFLSNYWFMIFTNKINFVWTPIRPEIPVWISTRPDRSCSIPTWAHFHQELLDKLLKDRDEVACPKCRKLLHVEKFNTHLEFNSSLIFMRETYELSCVGEYANRAKWPTGNWNDQSTIFQEIRS